MRINHNISALNAWQSLGQTDNAMTKSLERLSSGLRINRAADDAAGLAISEKMRGQIRGLNQAVRNAQDAISLIQTAEGALNETHSILQRMRELAVQSSTDTNTAEDRKEIQEEMNQLSQELSRIADTTEFNTKGLLDGTFEGIFHIGANAAQNMTLEIGNMGAKALNVAGVEGANFKVEVTVDSLTLGSNAIAFYEGGSLDVVKLDGVEVGDDGGVLAKANFALTNAEGKIVAVSEDGKEYIAIEKAVDVEGLGSAVGVDAAKIEFKDPIISGKVKIDPTYDDDKLTSFTATATATAQISEDAKLTPGEYKVKLNKDASDAAIYPGFGVDDYLLLDSAENVVGVWNGTDSFIDPLDGTALFKIEGDILEDTTLVVEEITIGAGDGIDVSTQKAADAAITTIQDALNIVSEERSKLGAVQNRLEHTIANLGVAAENLTAAESRIRDVDMAQEIMEFTKNQILIQAGTAMLANANVRPQSVLQLLG